jgi:FKBP-type peptidyl-prolyl cis-trans isomerase
MKIKRFLLLLFGLLLFISSCDMGYKGFEKTENGLYYHFHVENATSHVAVNNEIIAMVMTIRTETDSVVQEAKQITTMMQSPKFKGDIFEALSLMHEGDSATFIIKARQYYNMYNYGQIPSFVKDEKTMLWFTLKIDSIISFEKYQSATIMNQQAAEFKTIEAYLQQNNITASSLPSGLLWREIKAGKGNTPQPGQVCVVHYTGKLLDGAVFDSSIGRDPFSFQLGTGQVIPGWDEGVALMKKGSKATLIIPSHLGYGERGAGTIPAHSPLVFEVELLDIK